MIEKVYMSYPKVTITLEAGEALGKYNVVVVLEGKVYKASSANLDHSSAMFLLTTNAVSPGRTDRVLVTGLADDPTWGWIPNQPILVGLNGEPTQNPPTSGFIKVIGIPLSKTQFIFKPETTIILA